MTRIIYTLTVEQLDRNVDIVYYPAGDPGKARVVSVPGISAERTADRLRAEGNTAQIIVDEDDAPEAA